MIREAIVLAGGLGTRLREAVPDLPKCMAPVAGKPFLEYLIQAYEQKGIERFILSLGYKADFVINHFQSRINSVALDFVIEKEPLGTGGAIMLCLEKVKAADVLILNGDTFYDADLALLFADHQKLQTECTLTLKPMINFDRYGAVQIDTNNMVQSFFEKRHYDEGLINCGVYAANAEKLRKHRFAEKFSFEKEYLEVYCKDQLIGASIQDKYFIDIGIPSDYDRAQIEIPEQINK